MSKNKSYILGQCHIISTSDRLPESSPTLKTIYHPGGSLCHSVKPYSSLTPLLVKFVITKLTTLSVISTELLIFIGKKKKATC